MTRKALVLPSLLLLASVFSSPSWACSVTCGGNTCNGTGDCHCDVVPGGTVPHCTDSSVKAGLTAEYVDNLRAWSLPGLNRMADAAEDMMKAIETNDLAAYQQALDRYNRAEIALSKVEREIHSELERATREPINRER